MVWAPWNNVGMVNQHLHKANLKRDVISDMSLWGRVKSYVVGSVDLALSSKFIEISAYLNRERCSWLCGMRKGWLPQHVPKAYRKRGVSSDMSLRQGWREMWGGSIEQALCTKFVERSGYLNNRDNCCELDRMRE